MFGSSLNPFESTRVFNSSSTTDSAPGAFNDNQGSGFDPGLFQAMRQALITFNSQTGIVTVSGTADDDRVYVQNSNNNLIKVTIAGLESREFRASDVNRVDFFAKAGDDRFTNSTSIQSRAYGQMGDDVLVGGTGDDVLRGGLGADEIDGRAGDDRLIGDQGKDSLLGGSGSDHLEGGDHIDTLDGGRGSDTISGGSGDDVIRGGGGNDVLTGGRGNDQLFGGSENDNIDGGYGDDIIRGEKGNDQLKGSSGDDEIHGDSGINIIHGDYGNDVIYGGDAADKIFGGNGDDEIHGEAGFDLINGHLGNDQIYGGDGRDTIYAGDGDDSVDAGSDLDRVFLGNGDDIARGQSGIDFIYGEKGDDEIYGQDHDDRLYGGEGHDIIHGDGGNDRIYGGKGHDRLYGDADGDTIYGGDGNDGLFGGGLSNRDILIGEGGSDRFLVQSGDRVQGRQAGDAVLHFVNKTSNWIIREIEILDEGFHKLHMRTGNTRLLKDRLSNDDLRFIKFRSLGGNAAAVNVLRSSTSGNRTTYEREIQIADWNENDVNRNLFQPSLIIHEISHNWDSELEMNAQLPGNGKLWQQFISVGAWRANRTANYLRSGDRKWWYHPNAEFARSYGNFNPNEDFATIWEEYFSIDSLADVPRGMIRNKLLHIDKIFDIAS